MFCESLETRRFLTVTLQPGSNPDLVVVTLSNSGAVTISAQEQKGGKGGSKGGSHKGGSGGNGKATLDVSVLEQGGTLTVIENQTGAVWTVTGTTAVNIAGGKQNDVIFYTGNTIGANITGDKGDDAITVEDDGSGSSTIDAGEGDDTITIVHGNQTHASGGKGNDVFSINSGNSGGTAVVDGNDGNDFFVMYSGQATINGGNGNDQLNLVGGTATVTNVP